jgi:predicted  nucleic acid-binding Zn-ribbon protein
MKLKTTVLFILVFSSAILSQTDSLSLSQDEIQSLIDNISVRLLLNDNQKNELSKILSNHASELAKLRSEGNDSFDSRNKLINNLEAEIKSLFDNKQKMKYEIIGEDWLEMLKTEENDQ